MNENLTDKNKLEIKRELIPKEKSSIARMKQKRSTHPASIFRAGNPGDNESSEIGLAIDKTLKHQDGVELFNAQISDATGAANSDVGLQLLCNLGKAFILYTCKSQRKRDGKPVE